MELVLCIGQLVKHQVFAEVGRLTGKNNSNISGIVRIETMVENL